MRPQHLVVPLRTKPEFDIRQRSVDHFRANGLLGSMYDPRAAPIRWKGRTRALAPSARPSRGKENRPMEAGVRNAIARIEVIDNQRILSRGTGFLVADGLALTALHVVADRTKELLTPYPGEIVLSFPNLRTKAVIDQNHWDRAADWALLH